MLSCPQAAAYKLDFVQERADREVAEARLEEEKLKWQTDIAILNEMLRARQYDESAAFLRELKGSSGTVEKVSNGLVAGHNLASVEISDVLTDECMYMYTYVHYVQEFVCVCVYIIIIMYISVLCVMKMVCIPWQ